MAEREEEVVKELWIDPSTHCIEIETVSGRSIILNGLLILDNHVLGTKGTVIKVINLLFIKKYQEGVKQ